MLPALGMAIMPGLRIVQANAIWTGVALWRLAILSSVWLHDRRPSPTGLYAMTGILCREHQGQQVIFHTAAFEVIQYLVG